MTELRGRFTVLAPPSDGPVGRDGLMDQIHLADALVVTLVDQVDKELLAKGQRLKVVAVYAVGYNNVDVAAAAARGIVVTNTPDALTETTADLTWGLMLAVARRIQEGERLLRAGQWRGWAPTGLLGSDVYGKTLGLIGMGRIGRAVARRAVCFGMRTFYHSRHPLSAEEEQALHAGRLPLHELLRLADFVSLHVPLTPETFHLIGAAELALMKPTAYLINTARGPLVDERALAEALIQRRIAGAALDVFEEEPRVHQALLGLSNVVLSPHLGSATQETRIKMGMMMIENITAVLEGKAAPNEVRA